MRDLEVRHCRVLVAVSDNGGVAAAARALGLAQSTVSETLLSLERVVGGPVTFRRPGREATLTPAAEALLLAAALPKGARLAALDQRGRGLDSPGFAQILRRTADSGVRDLAFAIGGPDGLDPAFRAGADHVISFGAMVWPHLLVRVMLAEQLYRATSILAGTPYHRT